MAGTVTVAESVHAPVKKIKWSWQGTAGGAADLITQQAYYGEVLALVTIPGAGGAAPSDDYDITVTDEEGYDVMQGAGNNRDTANTETAVPTAKSVAHGKLTLNVTNSGASKSGTAILYIR
jgi:outer membrane usher protein FimD/PapC